MPQKVEILEDVTAIEIPTQEEINRFRESNLVNYLLSDSEIIIELSKEKKRENNSSTTTTCKMNFGEALNKDTIEDFLSRAGIAPLFFQKIGLDSIGMGIYPEYRKWSYGLYVSGVCFHVDGMPWPRAGYTGNSDANRVWWFRQPLSQYISDGNKLPLSAHKILHSIEKAGGIPLNTSLLVWIYVDSPAPDIATMGSMLVLELSDSTCIPLCKIEGL